MNYNYKIIIEYIGKGFVGWQIQKNGTSIQEIIEKALSKTLKSKIKVNGSGRTDAGVNAIGQTANFILKTEIKNKFKFLSTVNYYLNKFSISIIDLKKKELNFHARHSAKKRVYEYIISNRKTKLSIDKHRAWLVKLDIKKMKRGANYFLGIHDFSAFRASTCSAKSPVKKIINLKVKKNKEKIIFIIESKSFLQKQVRSMIGCLKYVRENKWKPDKIKEVIRSKAGKNALRQHHPKGCI